jgi:hypothetical protein
LHPSNPNTSTTEATPHRSRFNSLAAPRSARCPDDRARPVKEASRDKDPQITRPNTDPALSPPMSDFNPPLSAPASVGAWRRQRVRSESRSVPAAYYLRDGTASGDHYTGLLAIVAGAMLLFSGRWSTTA